MINTESLTSFSFVSYNGKSCILIDRNNDVATIAGLFLYDNYSCLSVYEADVKIEELEPIGYEVNKQSMLYRLMNHRKKYGNIYNFVDEEISLIHQFKS